MLVPLRYLGNYGITAVYQPETQTVIVTYRDGSTAKLYPVFIRGEVYIDITPR